MKDRFYITIILVLLACTFLFWQRAKTLSHRLELIQARIEETKKELIKAREAIEPKYKAKMAIVLDDFGYNQKNVRDIFDIKEPLTLAILPHLAFSKKIAIQAEKKGFEPILHLPLEPHENLGLEKGTILTSMDDNQINALLDKAIAGIPGIRGISNHMGSKATEDERIMSIVFEKMNTHRLYFLDSLVTAHSVCKEVSRSKGVPFANRSVFLDNESDVEYIKNQINELAGQALATGWAIGIGHDKPQTITALKEMLPILKDLKIKIVPASELAR